jgi:hypothetical protein
MNSLRTINTKQKTVTPERQQFVTTQKSTTETVKQRENSVPINEKDNTEQIALNTPKSTTNSVCVDY